MVGFRLTRCFRDAQLRFRIEMYPRLMPHMAANVKKRNRLLPYPSAGTQRGSDTMGLKSDTDLTRPGHIRPIRPQYIFLCRPPKKACCEEVSTQVSSKCPTFPMAKSRIVIPKVWGSRPLSHPLSSNDLHRFLPCSSLGTFGNLTHF